MVRASDVSSSYVTGLRDKGYSWSAIAKITGATQSDLEALFGGPAAQARMAEPMGMKRPRPSKPVLTAPPTPQKTAASRAVLRRKSQLEAMMSADSVAMRDLRLDRDYSRARVGVWSASLGLTAVQSAMLEVMYVLAGEIVPQQVLFERTRPEGRADRAVQSVASLMQNQMCQVRRRLVLWDADAAPVTVSGVGWQLPVPVAQKLAALAAPVLDHAHQLQRLRLGGSGQ